MLFLIAKNIFRCLSINMKIARVYQNFLPNNSICTNFKSSDRIGYRDMLEYKTSTCFFRNDINWQDIVKTLEHKYKNTDKVNVIVHACSSGEEPLSLALRLDDELGENAKKYFPITAKDYDATNIKMAKSGYFNINDDEYTAFKKFTKFNRRNFIMSESNVGKYLITNQGGVVKNLNFSQADIINDIDNIPSDNTVLFCRNFWPYLKISEQKDAIKKLGEKLKSSSMVVIGCFDTYYGVDKIFVQNGFKHTNDYCVMEKLPNYKVKLMKLTKKLGFI